MSEEQTTMQNQSTNDHSLSSILGYILSKEGLEQNLDLALNMTDTGEIPIQLILCNSNIVKRTQNLQELLIALGEVEEINVDAKRLVVIVDIPPSKNSIIVTNVGQDDQAGFANHVRTWEKADEIVDMIYKRMEQNMIIRLQDDNTAKELQEFLRENQFEASSNHQVIIQSESYSSIIKERYKDQAAKNNQRMMMNMNNMNNMNMQMNMNMMNMVYMQMMQNPYYQMSMMNMMQMPQMGANFAMPKNNMFIRRAKDGRSSNNSGNRRRGHHHNYHHQNRRRGYNNDHHHGGRGYNRRYEKKYVPATASGENPSSNTGNSVNQTSSSNNVSEQQNTQQQGNRRADHHQKERYNNSGNKYNNNNYTQKRNQHKDHHHHTSSQNNNQNQQRVRFDSDNFPCLPTRVIEIKKNKVEAEENQDQPEVEKVIEEPKIEEIEEEATIEKIEEKEEEITEDNKNIDIEIGVPESFSDDEKEAEGAAIEITNEFLIEYFKKHLDNIKQPEKLKKLSHKRIPILEHSGDVRLEQITPTLKKDYWGSESRSRKGSRYSARKGSFRKNSTRKGSGRKGSGRKGSGFWRESDGRRRKGSHFHDRKEKSIEKGGKALYVKKN